MLNLGSCIFFKKLDRSPALLLLHFGLSSVTAVDRHVRCAAANFEHSSVGTDKTLFYQRGYRQQYGDTRTVYDTHIARYLKFICPATD